MKDAPDRIVFDTNILISAFLYPDSVPGRCLRIAQRQDVLLVSQATLEELAGVLLRSKFGRYLSLEARIEILLTFRQTIEIVPVSQNIQACRDPRDDKFLSLAVSGRAEMLITGDADLLELHPFRGVAILSPLAYLAH